MTRLSVSLLVFVGVGALLLAAEPAHARRHYLPGQGRWLQRDPLGTEPSIGFSTDRGSPPMMRSFLPTAAPYRDGINLYEYARSGPGVNSDPSGLYNRDTHYFRTHVWANATGMRGAAARLVAQENDATDGGSSGGGGTGWSPVNGDQSRHFDRNNASIPSYDSRIVWAIRELSDAKIACNPSTDDPSTAARHLGRSLHSQQDYWAHGDYSKGFQNTWRAHGGPPNCRYDEWNWDAATTADARPPQVFDATSGDEIDYTDWIIGTTRSFYVQSGTRYYVWDFLQYVRSPRAGCKCKKFFLP